VASTQKDIAEKLGLSRTTVSKILNRDPKYYASDKTRKKVFAAAEALDYDYTSIRRPYKRLDDRVAVNAPCEISISLADGEIFDTGQAVVVNLSAGGALVASIRTGRMVLPLQSFRILARLSGVEELSDLVGECEIVRMTHRPSGPEIAVKFVDATRDDRGRVRAFVRKRLGLSADGPPGPG